MSSRRPRRWDRAASSAPTRSGSTRASVRAAQVLLTASDLQLRTHYLNARQTLSRLLAWRVVPVVNENDTTATDEITFGDNDFLAAQVAIMLEARLLVLLTDQTGLYTKDPRRDEDAELVSEVTTEAQLGGYEIGEHTSPFGLGGMRSKVAAAGMAGASGHRRGDLRRDRRGDPAGRRRWRADRHPLHAASRADLELQALAPLREAESRQAARRRRRCPRPARERQQPAARRDHRGRGRVRRR